MRSFFAVFAALVYSCALFAQTPLTVDGNTIALWNFDLDSQNVVSEFRAKSNPGDKF